MSENPDDVVLFPDYFSIVEKTPDKWGFWPSKRWYPVSESSAPKPLERFQVKCLKHQLNWKAVLAEIKDQYSGKVGFYLANLRDREYHYCGTELRDIKTLVKEKGIGF